MGELRQIKILSVKSLIVASLALELKEFHKALVGTSVKFKNTQNGLTMRKIWSGTNKHG